MWEQLLENETAVRSGKPNDTASLTVLVGVVKCVERLSLAPGVVSGHAGGVTRRFLRIVMEHLSMRRFLVKHGCSPNITETMAVPDVDAGGGFQCALVQMATVVPPDSLLNRSPCQVTKFVDDVALSIQGKVERLSTSGPRTTESFLAAGRIWDGALVAPDGKGPLPVTWLSAVSLQRWCQEPSSGVQRCGLPRESRGAWQEIRSG